MSVSYRTEGDATGEIVETSQDGRANQPLTENRPKKRARHRRQGLTEARRAMASEPKDRLRLLAWSLLGIGCLLTAHWIQPEHRLLFAFHSSPVGWLALLTGVTGLWLVPGLWISAVVARTGAGQPAWLGTRIATTLVWYAMAGPVIHRSAEGARVTAGGLLIATVAATSAVLIGVAIGLSRWPARPWLRVLFAAVVGTVGAQTAIWVSMRVWTYDMNYEHIRHLNWLIVVCCALLAVLGTVSRPKLPAVRTKRQLLQIVVLVAVVAATLGTIRLTSAVWSPAQQMPSVVSAEQTTAPPGTDLAFALNVIGPEGARLFDNVAFTVADDTGRPVPASTRIDASQTSATQATLQVVLSPEARPMLCPSIQAAKLTVRDQTSGVQVQAFVPDGWCAG